jgi:uncharacterized SAM-binding protein YcdF (DUF218 family)
MLDNTEKSHTYAAAPQSVAEQINIHNSMQKAKPQNKPTARAYLITLCVSLILIAGIIIGGFSDFASRVTRLTIPEYTQADAIVVLTGGADRIAKALDLLSESKAQRLLISGVHPSTSVEMLAEITGKEEALFSCCVDIGTKALNTIGNALETKAWLEESNFQSLLVVTSAYHIPRSLLELEHVMPAVHLTGIPVGVDTKTFDRWWQSPTMVRLLFIEYIKFLTAKLRLTLESIRV